MQARPEKDEKKYLNDFIQTLFLLTKDFINVLGRRTVGFHKCGQLFELKFLIRKAFLYIAKLGW